MTAVKDFAKLQKKLKTKFNNPDLLQQAFIHRSYLNENRGCALDHNERLEFLGDAVMELIVTEHLYRNYPNPEGELTNWRSSLVNGKMISIVARRLGFEEYLYLSRGEQRDAGRARELILANCFEAVIGALYLDQGFAVAQKFIHQHLVIELPHIIEENLYRDPKSQFQEIVQEKIGITPTYQVISETGPDHNKHFVVGAYIKDQKAGEGAGPSKQTAQLAAAEDALKKKTWK
jgi:ribonuclease-3